MSLTCTATPWQQTRPCAQRREEGAGGTWEAGWLLRAEMRSDALLTMLSLDGEAAGVVLLSAFSMTISQAGGPIWTEFLPTPVT